MAMMDTSAGKSGSVPSVVATRGIIVLGMHRSGTSCLTGLLNTSGVWLGGTSFARRAFGFIRSRSDANGKGSLEDRPIRRLNNRILQEAGGDWHCPPVHLDLEHILIDPREVRQALAPYARRRLWAIKDPRMVLTLDFWLPHFARADLVGTFRSPTAVAASLLKRNGFPLEKGLEIWTTYNRRLVERHRSNPFPLVHFDATPTDYLRQYEIVCQMLTIPYNGRAAAAWFESELVREPAGNVGGIASETAELYEYLYANAVLTR